MGFLKSVVSNIPAVKFTDSLTRSFSGQKQQDDANAQAMTAWNLMNDYNHPIQQMERLKAAGLNPLLVYGSGSVTGNTTGSPALVGGGVSTGAQSLFKGLGSILNLAQGRANIEQTQAQTVASNASAGASTAQASNLNAQAALNDTRAKYEEKSLIADLDYKKALTQKVHADARTAKVDADNAENLNKLFGELGGPKGAELFGKGGAGIAKALSTIGRAFFRG